MNEWDTCALLSGHWMGRGIDTHAQVLNTKHVRGRVGRKIVMYLSLGPEQCHKPIESARRGTQFYPTSLGCTMYDVRAGVMVI